MAWSASSPLHYLLLLLAIVFSPPRSPSCIAALTAVLALPSLAVRPMAFLVVKGEYIAQCRIKHVLDELGGGAALFLLRSREQIPSCGIP